MVKTKKSKSKLKLLKVSPLTRSFRDYIRNRRLQTPFGNVTPEDVEATGNYTNFFIGRGFYTGAYNSDKGEYFSLRGWIPYEQEQDIQKKQKDLVGLLGQITERGGIVNRLVIPLFKQSKEDSGWFTVFFEIRGFITRNNPKRPERELNELVWRDFIGPLTGYFNKQ